jgi:arabinose-5-phosphate isomerase
VIDQVMVSDPRSTIADALAAEVVQLMRQHSINGLFAVDPEQRPIGALNALDLMRAGIF